ncbi:MAG TPA: flagellar basal body rod C-terminal domain-containing protein [Kineosporiaceae bacterium]|nr:flagellar basal body rod C-terminal domain-containing protein [Kineosporiaceae bacterium]
MFEALGTIGSGMHLHQTWMDAISDNIANVNTVRPAGQPAFQARYVVAQSVENGGTGAGVAVAGIALGNAQGRLVFSPDNPLADAKGYVRLPDIDLGEQMTTMIMAQRGYQANAANLDRVRASYQAALQMGRN